MKDIQADQMIISVEEYERFKRERDIFTKEKERHIKDNLVCTQYKGIIGGQYNTWEKESDFYKSKYRVEFKNKFKNMSIFEFMKWKKMTG